MRTDEQRLANEIDCDIYRLILKAERKSKDVRWYEVELALRDARVHVRRLMHTEDREQTA